MKVECSRAEFYLLLAVLLREPPTTELLHRIKGNKYLWKTESSVLELALRNLSRMAEEMQPESLAQEYHELFIGVTSGELLPYASWYLTGCLHETPLSDLRRDLMRLGIVRAEGQYEPEDHVTAVFEAMALLIEDEDPRQQHFFENQVNSWSVQFFEDLQKSSTARFYRAVAVIGSEWLMLERKLLVKLD